ncbi:unnamed protein product [Linum trigynum]|uniref:Uncharacterized protein n=1 Tax=Linum trigynum TaxID=586398 RepID=A0AAV2F3G0_9ROSI
MSIVFEFIQLLSVVTILDIHGGGKCCLATDKYEHSPCFPVGDVMELDVVTVFAFLGLEFEKYLAASDNIPTGLPTPLHHLQVLEMPNIFLDSLQEAQFLLCLHELPQLAPAQHSSKAEFFQ